MDDRNKQIWQAVLGELELSLSKASFNTWLKDTFIAEICDGRVVVAVPNTFSQAWLKQKYHSKIYQILQKGIKDRIKDIVYKVQSVKNFQQQQDQLKKNITFESKRIGDSYGFKASPLPNTGLNPRYTFETFVVGRNSQLAHAASLAVAEKPGKMYNPFFIYGGVGLGKTHLMHAVGHSIFKADPSKKIIYVTCEKFTNDFINSISAGKMEQFNNIYRSPDVFLIDDIQFLANKEQTQEIFFHIFNELHQKDKQIIITSDRPPKAIATLEDRLLSRFEWGMIADISQPDLETRIAILQAKCTEKEFALEREIIQFITLNIQNNIRELEGALNKIIAYHQLNKLEPTLENIKKILFSISESSKKGGSVTAKQLIEAASNYYELTLDEILGKSREKRLAFPRQIIMYLLREELNYSYPNIGSELGGRDHTTAMHAYDKIKKMVEDDEKLRSEISMLKQKIYAI
jgi:chromosomal replication initiator protein